LIENTLLLETGNTMDKSEGEDLPAPLEPLKMYLAEVRKYPVLSREEEFRLACLAHDHDDQDAAHRLAISNLRLVVKIALEYYSTYVNVLDLIQEGNVGLLHALKKFNPYIGTRFSSYASFWIRAYILKYIMDSWSLVKVGTTQGQRRLFYRLNKEKRRLEASGIYPTPQVLAASFRVKEEEINTMEQRLTLTDVSLGAPLRDGTDETIMDTISSDEDVEEVVSEREKTAILSKKVTEFRQTLGYRDSFVFDNRIMTEEPLTLRELGEKFSISRERVRQVETSVVKRFKKHFREDVTSMSLIP
jgi:RNA polymerase sigma-32 factor